ncbi:HAD-superfamily phosphatase, subfamily IIIC/FkbH-like domain-containing protein [Granulicella pectinivorans]|uniref:HAD-superfamily phosphatase, subfamily IIIC/FkbH-like domain-containing protein n=1 Tax=Granulicella pectinivorans TaxID=474950 RepID=A0A1I6M5J7_9BACT|nr:HAD-IIIC family phosphatase [Granulicella pectinivorans]SFS10913.1 HAD-superfamily phosphatase, subfamily IIIC/FkbH-like domain-containing protein [Granulicella pectinivorans]
MRLHAMPIETLQRKRKGIRRELQTQTDLHEIRIAVLGGSTTNELVDFLELLLLDSGFNPTFYQSEYNRYYEDAVLEPELVVTFRPDIIYIHTTAVNIRSFPPLSCTEVELRDYVYTQVNHFRSIWQSLQQHVDAQIIQNNFEAPATASLGNLDAVLPAGHTRYTNEVNLELARVIGKEPRVILQDIQSIAARLGLVQWSELDRWWSYKLATTVEGSFAIAASLASIIRAIYGKSRKCLVLDLDNTLWGGVIGDDGPDKIQIGRETPVAEAYTGFQEYCLSLRNRGILLAVCSKNNEEIAKQGFDHPDSILKLEHFAAFRANWEPKHENILSIAKELNLGVDSFVFVDDNPAERAIVEGNIAGIAVPDVGSDVSKYAGILDAARYFETTSLAKDDLQRAKQYEENAQRAKTETKFANYGEYLDSLEMTAEIELFQPVYMERIVQLTNKTNQFNLTTRRYTLAEMEAAISDGQIGIYGKLTDRFGDNGLVSVVLGRVEGPCMHIDLWLMSCRVLKREMEIAMLDVLAEQARQAGVETIHAQYLPTAKNAMVADHYEKLGFTLLSRDDTTGVSTWSLDIRQYEARTSHIKLPELSLKNG